MNHEHSLHVLDRDWSAGSEHRGHLGWFVLACAAGVPTEATAVGRICRNPGERSWGAHVTGCLPGPSIGTSALGRPPSPCSWLERLGSQWPVLYPSGITRCFRELGLPAPAPPFPGPVDTGTRDSVLPRSSGLPAGLLWAGPATLNTPPLYLPQPQSPSSWIQPRPTRSWSSPRATQ